MMFWVESLLFLLRMAKPTSSYQNIYGNALEPCSTDGMALTGYTRNSFCVDQDDDAGSHHICINLSSIASTGKNFCEVTGQSDWCSSYMPCHESQNQQCPVGDWCVCQWAFASYIQNAGGCDAIQDVKCEAINMQALKAYEASSGDEKIASALACLLEKCG